MINLRTLFGAMLLTGILASCGGSTEPEKQDKEAEQTCLYRYVDNNSSINFTAFKFTDKTAVKGSFTAFEIEGLKKSDDPKKLIESLSFSIPVTNASTDNEERDGKIQTSFFQTFKTEKITGKVKSLGENGDASVLIKMNAIEKEVMGKYTLNEGMFNFKATIDLNDWNGQEAIKALNTKCKDLHTGPDGKSMLWSEVEIEFATQLLNDCD